MEKFKKFLSLTLALLLFLGYIPEIVIAEGEAESNGGLSGRNLKTKYTLKVREVDEEGNGISFLEHKTDLTAKDFTLSVSDYINTSGAAEKNRRKCHLQRNMESKCSYGKTNAALSP